MFVKEEEQEEEEDLVDPQDELKESCSERQECVKLKEIFDDCEERVQSRSNTTETCSQELLDFLHCVDHCVSHTPH